jgi:hypothetical protein
MTFMLSALIASGYSKLERHDHSTDQGVCVSHFNTIWLIYIVLENSNLEVKGGGRMMLGPVEGSCEHDNEPSVSIKYWEFLE